MLRIAAFQTLATVNGVNQPLPIMPPAQQLAPVTVTVGASAQSAALTQSSMTLISADEDCLIEVGANPTASASSAVMLPAGSAFWCYIVVGHKVAAFGL